MFSAFKGGIEYPILTAKCLRGPGVDPYKFSTGIPSITSFFSQWYRRWSDTYEIDSLPELELRRPALHRWLALRSSHGDFDWYHRKFNHEDAKLDCSCGRRKSPEHLALCHKTQRSFRHWPKRPPTSPTDGIEAVAYLRSLDPKQFVELLELTSFCSRVCTR
ncbi:hypothetical protein PDIDSM_1905 [Penicillium digitatum]|nr:hypothetical protein PDIDSM_1905 [Penicillium digitatum]